MTNEERLLNNLEGCRWEALHLLADEAEERGDATLAAGYRWLADNQKWPLRRLSSAYYWYFPTARGEITMRGARGEEAILPLPVAPVMGVEVRGDRSGFSKQGLGFQSLMRDTARAVGEWLKQEGG